MLFSERICSELGYSKKELSNFLRNSPRKYRVYTIPKRTLGFRTIAHPSKELKLIQRECDKILKEILPIHECAFAYKKGSSIKKNALQHVNQPYLLKMDFSKYFNSITPNLFWKKVENLDIVIDERERNLINKIIFWQPNAYDKEKLMLSIGAPTSPLISNFVAYDFDLNLNAWCLLQGIVYTRYADDLTFSTNKKNILTNLPRIVKAFLKIHLDGVTVNEIKTKFSSMKHNRHVTGITLTDENGISLGRKNKRVLFHLVHKYSLGLLEKEKISNLQGLIFYFEHIQPGFINRLEKKYSTVTIQNLLKGI